MVAILQIKNLKIKSPSSFLFCNTRTLNMFQFLLALNLLLCFLFRETVSSPAHQYSPNPQDPGEGSLDGHSAKQFLHPARRRVLLRASVWPQAPEHCLNPRPVTGHCHRWSDCSLLRGTMLNDLEGFPQGVWKEQKLVPTGENLSLMSFQLLLLVAQRRLMKPS